MDNQLAPLRASVGRLHQLCRGLDDAQLEAQSYCSEWSIADVLSHLGSAAVIMRRRLEDALAGRATPDDFPASVWDEWNAKPGRAKADDALVVDEAVLEALESVSPADRSRLTFPMGPLTFDFDQFASARVNEHALHTWDIEVVFDDDAHLPHDAAAVDRRQPGADRPVHGTAHGRGTRHRRRHDRPGPRVHPPPGRRRCGPGRGGSGRAPDLVLPAEAFCRLVYGRLDAAHTPSVTGDAAVLGPLRSVFPGP